ncbi:MAG: YdcF family protein [Candidatus Paceibacterota bacterium]
MNKEIASQKIWDYMLMHQTLKKADMILVLGNRDTRVAECAAQLYLDGWAPVLVCSGSGSIHNDKPGREQFVGTTEAEVFANIAIKMGVPKESIIIENESQNTGENFEFAIKKLKDQGIDPKCIIIVQKPYAERRAYAAGKRWLPKTELILASPSIPFEKYPNSSMSMDQIINSLVGDMQRIKEYPKKGFQIEQEIPRDVWDAYEYLIKLGYTKRLI